MQNRDLVLSISLTIFLVSLTHFTIIINIPNNVLAQTPTLSSNETYHFVKEWGSNGTAEGQFQYPQGIATDSSDNVYVVDSGNNRIQKFSSNGNFITKWGSSGTGDGQFDRPTGIATDSSDNVYVAEFGNDRIQKFDSSGSFITEWGSEGIVEWQFDDPFNIAIDSINNAYVADTGNNRVEVFAPGINPSIISDGGKFNGENSSSTTTGNTTANSEKPTPSQPTGITDQV